jgi:DNA-binding NarL/FixJ family response regulator
MRTNRATGAPGDAPESILAEPLTGWPPAGGPIEVGVIDDHDLMLAGVRALLAAPGSPARYAAGAHTVSALLDTGRHFDAVLLDVRLADGSRCEDNVRRLAAAGHRVLLHADSRHREAAPTLARTEAAGLVLKNDPARQLLEALTAVARGGTWHTDQAVSVVSVTERESQVLRLYTRGLTYAQTAAALTPPVGVESVKTYLQRVRRRYEEAGRPASSRLELRQRALEDGLLGPDDTAPLVITPEATPLMAAGAQA